MGARKRERECVCVCVCLHWKLIWSFHALPSAFSSSRAQGVRLKMDDMGNIVIKRMSNCDVFIRGWDRDNNSLSQEIVDLSGELEFEKSVKLFDMKKFQSCIARELRSAYPDRRKLENQCICAIAFVKDSNDLLDQCCWVLLINIVALDLLKSRFPTILLNRGTPCDQELVTMRNAPKFVSVFSSQPERRDALVSEEDPYSLPLPANALSSRGDRLTSEKVDGDRKGRSTSSTSNSSSSETKPPELPPRDFAKIKKSKGKNLPQAIKSLVKSNGKSVDKSTGESRAPVTTGNVTADEKRRQEIEYGECPIVIKLSLFFLQLNFWRHCSRLNFRFLSLTHTHGLQTDESYTNVKQH